MHTRFKIAFLFTFIMMLLLALFCFIVYRFSHTSRLENIQYQLTNQTKSSLAMLKEPSRFDSSTMREVDAARVLPLENKSITVYNFLNEIVYYYNQQSRPPHLPDSAQLADAKAHSPVFVTDGIHDSLFYYDPGQQVVVVAAGYDARGQTNLRQLGHLLILILIGGTLLAFTCGYYFSMVLLRPIKNIADEVLAISAKNLTQRIKSGSAMDEWNYLTSTLNDLLNRLQESFEVQRHFISSVSHELNTPLTAISSQLDVALLRERSTDYYKTIIGSVYEDVRELGKLTQTLLEFATLSGSPGGIELKMIRIDELLARLPAGIAKADNNYSVQLNFTKVPELEDAMLVFGNEALLFTAITNIVMNACKYSENKHADIELSGDGDHIIITVTDTGKGIAKEELENIFRPFYRTEDSRAVRGFGIGLPLVSRIIKIHHGQISVRSILGEGTSFELRLPAGSPKTTL